MDLLDQPAVTGLESRNLDDASRARGVRAAAASHKARADLAYADLVPVVTQLRAEGLSHRMIADRLNGEGHETRRHRPWNQVQVMRVLARSGAERPARSRVAS